jgi:hypothetical protein
MEIAPLINGFNNFCKADARLKPLHGTLSKQAFQALEVAFGWLPEAKPALFHQWYCRDGGTWVTGIGQRESFRLYWLTILFLEKEARGRYLVSMEIEEDAQEIIAKKDQAQSA